MLLFRSPCSGVWSHSGGGRAYLHREYGDDLLGDDQSTFSAASYTAQADGTVTIVVEPYYSEFFGDFSNGHYLLRVLVEQ